MIATHIIGGLGNQMFQFAAGKALALRLGVDLVLDDRYWDKRRYVECGLGNFAHGARSAPRLGLPAMKYESPVTYVTRKLRGTAWTVYDNDALPYDSTFSDLGDGTWLKGYFQSERYFVDHAEDIRACFQLTRPPSNETQAVMREMDNCIPVALHIRRGDMVNNTRNFAVHGTPALEYFRKAAELVASNCKETPTFFVFSDEPRWVIENFELDLPVKIVSHNGVDRNFEDIFLMSRCQHNITANSSFSWWGAWLNPNPGKVVVCPDRWFADPKLQNNSLVPESWTTIPSQ